MKQTLSARTHKYIAGASILLITVVLIVGLLACNLAPPGESLSIGGNTTPLLVLTVKLRIASSGPGSVTTPGEGWYTYPIGHNVTLVATADPDSQFAYWYSPFDPDAISSILDPTDPNTVVSMDRDYSIYAIFRAPFAPMSEDEVDESQTCCVNIGSSSGGSVVDPGEGCHYYYLGEWVDLVAQPEDGYEFVHWRNVSLSWIVDPTDADTQMQVKGCVVLVTAQFREIAAEEEKEDTCAFADANLEAAVREAIGKPQGPIYPSDLEDLVELNGSGKGISDLDGLECCTNLKELYLDANQISNISPVASLTSLTDLDLGGNQISDISPLDGLTNLERLVLDWNQIDNLSPLANLTSLTLLDLDSNQISDISPLASLINLTVLGLNYNEITDIDPTDALTSLGELRLYSNQISDVSVIADLGNLNYLDLGANQISDIFPLVANLGLSAGDTVYLGSNPLSDESENTYIPQLEERGVIVDY